MARVAESLQQVASANAAATAAQQKKAQVDEAARAAADQHRAALVQLREEYQQLVQAGSLEAAAAKLQEINKHLRDTPGAAQDAGKAAQEAAKQLEAAFERMGITSSAALKQQADNALRDFEIIKNSGKATAEDISAAFKNAADAAIAANKGIAPSWVQAQASVRGYAIETDSAGKSVLKLREEMDRTAKASGDATGAMQGHWGGVRDSVNQASEAVREYQQRMKEKYGPVGDDGKPDAGKGSAGGKGPEQQWVWTRAAIIDYLESSGLDKSLAEDLSQQFVQPDGSVSYKASDAQKRWGGKYSTLAEALGKMSDYYKYGDGKAEAAQRTQFLQGQQGGQPPAPAPAPAQSGGSSGSMFGSQSVTLNINLDGQGYGQVNTDSEGARTLQALMGELERAKRNTGR